MGDEIGGNAKLNVVVTANIDLSYQQIAKDLIEIGKKLSASQIPKVLISVDIENTQKNFQAQLQAITNNLKLNVAVTPAVSANSNSSLNTQVSTRKMSQATAELVKQKKANLELLNVEKLRHEKEMNAFQERSAKMKAELTALKTKLATEKAANSAGTNENRIKNTQNQAKFIDIYISKLNGLETVYQRLGVASPDFSSLKSSIKEVSSAKIDSTNFQKYADLIKQIKSSYSAAAQAAQTFNKQASVQTAIAENAKKINSLKLKLEALYNTNTKLRSNTEAMKEYTSVMDELTSGKQLSPQRVIELQGRVNELTASWKQSGLLAQTFGDKIKAAYEKFGGWMLITRSLMAVVRLFKQMVQNVSELDKAMTELKKVTSETEATYNAYLKTAIASSKELGATLTDVVTATADYARLGYNIVDATALAEASILYKNVGDGIESISDASESIISTMKAFGIEAGNASSIVDKFNEVGNNFAISSKGIGDALLRSASSLAAAGNTIDESIGMIVAMNNVLQDPDSVGTSLKTISMRLRNTAGELEELGEDSEGAAESVTKLQTQLLNLTSGKVNIMADANTFKSTYQIITELSKVWSELSDKAQADITRLVAGVRQGNAFTALMNNMTDGANAVKTSLDSVGSAMAENEKYMDSIAGKTAKFTAAFQELSANVIDSSIIKGIIDLGTGVLNLLNLLNDLHALLPLIIVSISLIRGYNIAKNVSTLTATMIAQKGVTDQMIASVMALSMQEKALLVTQIENAVVSGQITAAQGSQILTTLGLSTAEGTLTVANKGLAVSFKTLMASIPVWGWIALGVTVVIEAISALTEAVIKNKQEMIDNANAIIDNYKNAQDTYESGINTLTNLQSEFEKLSLGVDENGRNVSLTADEYDNYLSLVKQIVEISPNVCKGYDDEGRAIVNYKTLLDDAIASQESYLKNQRNIYLSSGESLFEGKSSEYEDAKNELSKAAGANDLSDNSLDDAINPSIWESLFGTDKAMSKIDAYKNAFNELGIVWRTGIDTWRSSTEQVMQMYEHYDEIMILLRKSGAYTEEELATIEDRFQGLAGAYTKLASIEREQIDYLAEWSKDQDWYKNIPTDALDEFVDGLTAVNDPLKDYSDNLKSAESFGTDFSKALSLNNVQSIISLSKGLKDGSVSLEEYNKAINDFSNSFIGSGDVHDALVSYLSDLSNLVSTSESSIKDISSDIDTYNQKIKLLNQLFAEQETNGEISAETYDYIRANCSDLTDTIEAQYDILGNFKSWQLNTSEANKYAEAQKEVALEVIEATTATAKQIASLVVYQGGIGSTSDRVKEICSDISDLSDAYAKVANDESFTYEEMMKLKDAFPDLQFEFEKTTDELGNITTGYKLNGETAIGLIKDNYNLLSSVQELRLEYIKLMTVMELMTSQGRSQSNAQQYVNVITNKILEDGITSFEEYAKSIGVSEDHIAEWIKNYVTLYTDALNDINGKKTELDSAASAAANNITSTLTKKNSPDKWKAAFDKQLSELDYRRDKEVISEAQYYALLRSLYEEYFGDKLRATITDTEKREEYLDLWRKYDVQYYNYIKDVQEENLAEQEKSIDKYIEYCEKQYKVHQNEKKYINDLTWALNEYKDVLTETQQEDISSKIDNARADYYDNLITDIEHEIELLERETNTEQKRIALYEKAQKILLDKKKYYTDLGYDATSDELQAIETEYNKFADNIVDIMESAFEDMVKAQKDSVEQMIDQIETEEDAIDKVLDTVVDYIKRQKHAEIDALNDNIDQVKESYDNAKEATEDYYDNLIDSTKDSYDTQREAQEKYYDDQREAQEQYYDNLIDSIETSRDTQVDALKDMVDEYKKLIDAKKESLQASRDQEKYDDEVASKNKNISSIQSQLDALQFDDSGSARAKRLKLEEELADAKDELSQYQTDYSLDKQLDALDNEYDAYESMMNEKIELIENESDIAIENYEKQKEAYLEMLDAQKESYFEMLEAQNEAHITSLESQKEAALKEQEEVYNAQVATLEAQIADIEAYLEKEGNLRRDANDLLKEGGQVLWDELMAYEYEYSEDIKDLQEAWNIAKGAMDNYNGGQLDAMQTLSTMLAMLEAYNAQLNALNNASYSNLVGNMKANSAKWLTSSDAERENLHQANEKLAQDYNNALGTNALQYNDADGKWYLGNTPLYHEGAKKGFVLQNKFPVPKDDEILAKLAAHEIVLTPPQLQRVAKTMFQIGASTPQLSGNNYNIDKLFEIQVAKIGDTDIEEVTKVARKIANEAIEKLQDGNKRKGVRVSAGKSSI